MSYMKHGKKRKQLSRACSTDWKSSLNPKDIRYFREGNSGTPVAWRDAKRSAITIVTEPHACIEIENYATLFSWSTWLAVWIVGASTQPQKKNVAQHGSHTPPNTKSCSLGLQHTSLILDKHVMVNWHLSKQGICWLVSHDYIASSSLELIKVTCFLSGPLTKY